MRYATRMQKALIIVGALILAAGLLWPWLSKLPLGRLPGDFAYKGDNVSFYFPLMTMIIVSVILSLLFRLSR